MTTKHPRRISPSYGNEKPESANPPKVHKILQGIEHPERFVSWGERWGSSDYATRTAPGADGTQEAQPIYDQQIAFSSESSSDELATAPELVEAQRRHCSRAQNRRSERCSVAKRAGPYRGTTLQKGQSTTAAVNPDPGLWDFSVSLPESYMGTSSRKRTRTRKVSASSSLRRHADPPTFNGTPLPVYDRMWPGATSYSIGSTTTSFPPCYITPPDDLGGSLNEVQNPVQPFHHLNFTFDPSHATSTSGSAQASPYVLLDPSPHATPNSGTPMTDYSHSSSDSMVWSQWPSIVTATRPLPPYADDPGANQALNYGPCARKFSSDWSPQGSP